jgi:pyruvate/2-oxoglutarate dehydrogenase complex dihydrolipoamide dehydrogenase (E3) component
MAERSGAAILLNTAADDALINRINPDYIIVATGSTPLVPTGIRGYERLKHATAVYFEPDIEIADSVVIIGGGLIGVETGLHLASLGRKVTVIEMTDSYASDAKGVYRLGIARAVENSGVDIITDAKAVEVTDKGVVYEKDGTTAVAPGGSVFYAVGMKAEEGPYLELCAKAPLVAIAGDCKSVGKVDGAVHGGYFAALDV